MINESKKDTSIRCFTYEGGSTVASLVEDWPNEEIPLDTRWRQPVKTTAGGFPAPLCEPIAREKFDDFAFQKVDPGDFITFWLRHHQVANVEDSWTDLLEYDYKSRAVRAYCVREETKNQLFLHEETLNQALRVFHKEHQDRIFTEIRRAREDLGLNLSEKLTCLLPFWTGIYLYGIEENLIVHTTDIDRAGPEPMALAKGRYVLLDLYGV